MKETVIGPDEHGMTVLSYLKKRFPVALIHKIFRKNGLRVNGLRAKEEMVLKRGDRLTFYLDLQTKKPSSSVPLRRGFDILHESNDFIVLNKHPGISVHEGKTVSRQQSLRGQLLQHYKSQDFTPLLVHRLDTNTSGCMIVAKNEAAKTRFEDMFKKGEIQKEYLVLVSGMLHEKKGRIQIPLPGRDGHLVSALTLYEVQQAFPKAGVSLVRAQIKTGRMHQIRLHFTKIQHPVVMDTLHGDFEVNKRFKKMFGLKRQFLHAAQLSFEWEGKTSHFEAPLSEDLDEVLKQLRHR
ncbi:MAG: RluA family pseudouridine synthase [Candidatus Altimarinota bacterium]